MSGARTLERGLEVLAVIRLAGRPISVDGISRATGLDRAVIGRLLPPLVDAGLVDQAGTPARYWGAPTSDVPASAQGDEDSWFADAMVDDAYFALLSFTAGYPMSYIAERVLGQPVPASFVAMMDDKELDDLGPGYAPVVERLRDLDPAAAFRVLYSEIPDRDLDILHERLSADPMTLEELADRHGLTRERVRQIVKKYRRMFASSLEATCAIAERAALARADIGGIVDMGELGATLMSALPMVDYLGAEFDELFFFLLFEEGTFSRLVDRHPWFVDEPTRAALEDVRVRALADAMPSAEFHAAVPAVGMLEDPSALLAALGLEEIDGEVTARNLSMNERAVRILRRTGSPMAFDDILGELPEGIRIRSLRNALLADDRVARVDKDTFALVEWGLQAYSTVRDLMRQEVEAAGGEARIADIAERLTARFDVKVSSINAYASGPEFVRVGPGVIRLRADDEPLEDPERPLHALRGCVRIDRRWALRVGVTASLLRGFSVTLPLGLAPHFGVAQGDSTRLRTDMSGEISLVRRGLQDNIGRLRWVAEELGLREGDILFVQLPARAGGRISFTGLSRSQVERASRRRRAGLLLGQGGDLTLPLACSALGLPRGSRPDEVVDRLRSRGEDELAALVGQVLGAASAAEVDTGDIARMLGI